MQYIVGTTISLFIAALLFNKRDKSQADQILMVWMIINALHLAVQYSFVSGLMMKYPFLYGIVAPLPLLHGIFLYLYVASATNQLPKEKNWIWAHFIPAILALAYLLRYFLFLPSHDQVDILNNEGKGHEVFIMLLLAGVMLSGVIYVIWSSILLYRHKQNIKDQFSGLDKVDLRWLQFLIYGLGAIWCVVIFSQDDQVIFYGVVVFVILTGFFGIQQIDIFKNRSDQAIGLNLNSDSSKEKYAKSGLTNEESARLYKQLNNLVRQKNIYKQQELSVSDLAEQLGTHPNYLSQVINECAGRRFYDYINSFRVEEFKKLVTDPKNRQFTMLSLAYECGFNSKSSFNRYFKKVTGLTPSQYVASLEKS